MRNISNILRGSLRNLKRTSSIDDIIITGADPRGMRNVGELYTKTQNIRINFLMAEAARALEMNKLPEEHLSAEFIRSRDLLYVERKQGHHSLQKQRRTRGII